MIDSNITNSEMVDMDEPVQYVGFWLRVIASLIDTVILFMLTSPILYLIYGGEYFDSDVATQGFTDFIISYLLPIAAVILFWIYKSATPGKMAISAKIVDENTGGKPTTKQYIIRYLSYYVSLFALGLGFFWIAWDEKKQGWHDKMAGTLVIFDNQQDNKSARQA